MYKTDVKGLYKTNVGAVVNADNDALNAYKRRKKSVEETKKMKVDIDNMKVDLKEIKEMLINLSRKG
jgi:peptidoglycan hydrolase CwlO-like protein